MTPREARLLRTSVALGALSLFLVACLAGAFAWWWNSNSTYLGHRRHVSDQKNAVVAMQQIATRAAVCTVLDAVPGHNPVIEKAKNQPYPLYGKPTQAFCVALPTL